jgi:hypothetical protein
MQYYQGLATSMYQPQGAQAGGASQTPGGAAGGATPQPGASTGASPTGIPNLNGWKPNPDGSYTGKLGYTVNANEAPKIAQLPQQFQGYVSAGPLGAAFIDGGLVPPTLVSQVSTAAQNAGIKYLQATDAAAIRSMSSIFQNLSLMKQFANTALSSGLPGRIAGLTLNQAAAYLQTGPSVPDPITGKPTPIGVVLQNFNQFKDAAGRAVTALSGGLGSGLRMSMPILENAVGNLPTSADSLEGALGKIDDFGGILMNQYSTDFPSVSGENPIDNTTPAGIQTGGASTGNGTVSVGGSNFVQNAQGQWVPQ